MVAKLVIIFSRTLLAVGLTLKISTALAQPFPAIELLTALPGYIRQVAVDKDGNIYLAGITFSEDFPVTPDGFQKTLAGDQLYPQGFLVKLNPAGSKILYATFLTGLHPNRLVVDDSGFMYIFADHYEQPPEDLAFYYPASFPFPITVNAAQTQPAFPASSILAKIAPTGELIYSTYVGGSAPPFSGLITETHIGAIAVDSRGAVTVCGSTFARDLTITATSFQRSWRGGWDTYVLRVSPDGTAIEAATYLGGAGDDFCEDLKLDASGNVYVFGSTTSRLFPVTVANGQTTLNSTGNLFVTSLDPELGYLRWSTLLPGLDAEAITFDRAGNVLLFGVVGAPSFPGAPDVSSPWAGLVRRFFATVLSPNGEQLLDSQTFSISASRVQMTADGTGNLYLTGIGGMSQGEVTDQTLNATAADPRNFTLARFSSEDRLMTFLGPIPDAAGFDNVYASIIPVGFATGPEKLLLAGAFNGGASATGGGGRLISADFSAERIPLVTQVRSSAWPAPTRISPGELVQIRGLGLGPADPVRADPGDTPTKLAETSVLFNDAPAPLVSVASTSVLVQAPWSLAGRTEVSVTVERDGVLSDARSISVVELNPGILTSAGTGVGQADAVNQDGSPNSSLQPTQKGRNVRLYVTGLGEVGASQNLSAVSVAVGGFAAPVVGLSPATDRSLGYFQIDVTIPSGAPESDFVLVEIQVNGRVSQPGVTVAVR